MFDLSYGVMGSGDDNVVREAKTRADDGKQGLDGADMRCGLEGGDDDMMKTNDTEAGRCGRWRGRKA
jgi:hypothetical protein